MRGMIDYFRRFWCAQNYAFCRSQAYLASQRGDNIAAGEWQTKADQWYLDWWRIGKGLK